MADPPESAGPPVRTGPQGSRHRDRDAAHPVRHRAATLALTANPPVALYIVAARLGDDPRTLLDTYAGTCCRGLRLRLPRPSPQFSLTAR